MAGRTNEEIYDEAEALANAIAGTEDEIFTEALDKDQDDNDGDRSLEEMDDDIPGTEEEEEEDTEAGEDEEPRESAADDANDGEGASPSEPRGPERVPSHRLREETARREAAESEARAVKAERDSLNARLTALERSSAPRQEASPPPAKPDIFADPEGYERYVIAQANRAAENRFLEASLADAQEQHGERFNAAYKDLTALNPSDPANRALVQRIISAPNPGRAVMKWHGEQALLREVGSDPAAYRQKVADQLMQDPDFRKQILDGMRGEANRGDGGRQRTTIRIPRSLSEAGGRGGNPRMGNPDATDNSDASVFEYATRR